MGFKEITTGVKKIMPPLMNIALACILLLSGFLKAEDFGAPAQPDADSWNIFSAIPTLVDSLQVWAAEPQLPAEDHLARLFPDSLDLAEFFPECRVTDFDSQGSKRISLPRYLDLLSPVLILDKTGANPRWTAPVRWDGEHLLVDSLPAPLSGSSPPDSLLIERMRENIIFLRTLGLPEGWRYPPSMEDTPAVQVTVRGRDMIDLSFTWLQWLNGLRKLTSGMMIYAGLLSVKVDSSAATVRYYILVTCPGARGHHFLEWREKLVKTPGFWRREESAVMFTPFIRADNVKDLFGKPDSAGREAFELRINR